MKKEQTCLLILAYVASKKSRHCTLQSCDSWFSILLFQVISMLQTVNIFYIMLSSFRTESVSSLLIPHLSQHGVIIKLKCGFRLKICPNLDLIFEDFMYQLAEYEFWCQTWAHVQTLFLSNCKFEQAYYVTSVNFNFLYKILIIILLFIWLQQGVNKIRYMKEPHEESALVTITFLP